MSLFSDLFEGNFGNLGRDIVDAPSSFVSHPTDILETLGAGAAALTGGAALGLFGADAGLGGAAAGFGGAAADAGTAAPLGFAADTSVLAPGTADIFSPITGAAGDAAAYDPFYTATGLNTGVADANAFSPFNAGAGVGTTGPGYASDPLSAVAGFGKDAASDPLSAVAGFGKDAATSGLDTTGIDTSAVASGGGDPLSAVSGTGKTVDPSLLDQLKTGVANIPQNAIDQVVKNPLGLAAAGAGLGYTMLQGQKQLPNQAQLQNQANQLTAQGQQFMNFLQTGTLPPGLQAAVDQAKASARATVIANHARAGQSTDPTQNSALAQELAAVDQNALIAVAQQGQMLFQSGMSEVQLSSQIYNQLMQVDQQQTANMGKSIASFAAALGSGVAKAA